MFPRMHRVARCLLAASLVLATTTRVQAQRERETPRNEIRGIVKSVDAGAGVIIITVGGDTREAAPVEKSYSLAKNVEVAVGAGAIGRGGLFKEAKLAELAAGVRVSLTLTGDQKQVDSILAESPMIRGQLKAVDAVKNTLTVAQPGGREQPGEEKTLTVAANAEIAVDEGRGRRFSVREAKLADLAQGAPVTLWLSLDSKQVQAALAEGLSHFGTIKAIDPAKRSLTLIVRPGRGDDAGEEHTVTVATDALVLLDDGRGRRLSVKEGKLTDVPAGAAAAIRMSMDQSAAVFLRVEGPSVFGMLKSVDADKGLLVIAIPKGRDNAEERTLTVAKDARVFLDGAETKLGSLKAGDPGIMLQLRLGLDQKTVQAVQARQAQNR